LVPIKDKSAVTVAEALVRDVFCRIGFSNRILSDLGAEYQNSIFKHVCKLLGVEQLRTTSYKPSTNGRCERPHADLHRLIAKLVQDKQKNWPMYIQQVALAHNLARHEATQYSPYFLFHGREGKAELALLFETPAESVAADVDEYAQQLVERLQFAFHFVQQNTGRYVERQKRQYDATVKESRFQIGQYVFVYYPRIPPRKFRKWVPPYYGPARVMKVLNSVTYIVQKTPKSKPAIVHIDKLKPYYGPEPEVWKSVECEAEADSQTFRKTLESDEENGSRFETEPELPVDDVGADRRPRRVIRPPRRYADAE
jgi:hypothetical protein